MKVLISVAVWGRAYRATLANFSLATQLAPDNIPKLAQDHSITYHVLTTRRDAEWLQRHVNFRALTTHAQVEWDIIENHGYNPSFIPTGSGGEKYPFLSRLQNVAIARSLDHNVIVFNYADFIWANGSLTNIIDLLKDGSDAILSFGLPVDRKRGIRAIERYLGHRSGASVIDLPPRAAAGIAIDCLHRETQLRFWDGDRFTQTPTYLIWRAGDEGLVVRAYHQTVLALRVQPHNPQYIEGIRHGSLDGYFTAVLAEQMRLVHATDSDRVLVFSLFDTNIRSGLLRNKTREEALQKSLRTTVSEAQRRFAEIPIFVKRKYENVTLWKQTVRESWMALERIHRMTRADSSAFEHHHAQPESIAFLEYQWRASTWNNILRLIYFRLLKLVPGRLGNAIKSTIGRRRSRSIRLAIEGWFSRRRT
jgi:hypothetical protein